MVRHLLLGSLVLSSVAVASAASDGKVKGVSHRSRLYDTAVHGESLFVVGHPGLVLRSTDHGQTYAAVSVPSGDALFSIDINKRGLGAIVGRAGLVLVTSDGGKTWSKTNALADTPADQDKPHLFAVDVLETGTIVAVGDFAIIVTSTDGGKSWTKHTFEPLAAEESGGGGGFGFSDDNAGAEGEARLNGVSFGDDQHGFVVGEFGLVLRSEDGGSSWKQQRGATDKLLFAVHATSAVHAVASGSDGSVVETTDGESWTLHQTATKNHLFGIWASKDACLAVGADGAAVSRQGTGDFKVVPTHVHTWLSSVALHDGKHGVVTGGLGHLLRTDNAGQTFSLVTGE